LTFVNDQIGLNARSLDDILLMDAALLNTSAQHAEAAAATPTAENIRVGLPRVPFVEFSDLRATEGMENEYLAVANVLGNAGVAVVHAEWAAEVNITEIARSDHVGYYTSAGQMAMWVQDMLDAPVSNVELVQDMYAIPGGHDPGSCFRTKRQATTSQEIPELAGVQESEFREYIATRPQVGAYEMV
jgi:Asp-tRNA(Asn)/Glu-tRNA(Gln) amidotransferase A subunit family amidase